MRILRCKRCGRTLNVNGSKIIHCTEDMVVIEIKCFICKRKNYLEAKEWKIK